MDSAPLTRAGRILKRVEPYLTPGQLAALREIVEFELEEAHQAGFEQGKDEAESGGEA